MFAANISLQRKDFKLEVCIEHDGAGVLALFGPSGCGKTSFLRALAGLEPATKGRIVIADTVWQDDQSKVKLPPWQRRLGMVFQEQRLFPHLNVASNLLFGCQARGVKINSKTWHEVIELLDLQELLQRAPRELSGGEARRVAIGRALLSDPSILLLDEPLSGLDAPRRAAVLPYLERLHAESKIPMIYISHQLDEVMRLSDRMLVMEAGKLIADGATLEMANQLQSNSLVVLEGALAEWNQSTRIATVKVGNDRIHIWSESKPVIKNLRIIIDARQVVISKQQMPDCSMLNQLACEIDKINPVEGGLNLLDLSGQGWKLKALISQVSSQSLELNIGDRVYAGIKATLFSRSSNAAKIFLS